MSNILVNNNFYISTSSACIVDLTPPTFSGITFLDVESRGQIRSGWSAATDATAPIRYEVYIQASTATGLFNTSNITGITPNLTLDIFTMPDGSFLVNGTTYYVGVRALDAVSNRDSNLVSMSVISTGVLTSIDMYETKAAWSINDSNQFELTAWAEKNNSLATSVSDVLGTASYQVYDKLGVAIVGMSASGISANAQGLYVMPAVSNLTLEERQHYEIKVSIMVDGEVRTNFLRIEAGADSYLVDGTSDVDYSGNLIGSFWVSDNEKILTSGLGTGSFDVYTADGNPLGISQSGIVANGSGLFVITPIPGANALDGTAAYITKVSVTVNGQTRTKNLILGNEPILYQNKAIFSINALNQLEATFWAIKNDERVNPALLGTAKYTVYDKNGTAVSGLTELGIVADGNGLFHSTPVLATLLTDLTHYSVKVEIVVAGATRTSFKGFTLLGT